MKREGGYNVEDLDWRAIRTLVAFNGKDALRYCDLPPSIGHKTMEMLAARGLVEVVDESVWPFSKYYAWRRKR